MVPRILEKDLCDISVSSDSSSEEEAEVLQDKIATELSED